MNTKEYQRITPNNTDKTHGNMPIVLTKKVRRNDPCPCGQTKFIEGTQIEIPVKFKNCCSTEK